MFHRKRTHPDPAHVYVGLRDALLTTDPADVRLAPSNAFPRVWAVLFELGLEGGTASVVGVADGTTSMYTSSGGGILGGGAHDDIVGANHAFLGAVEANLDALLPSDSAPLPGPGEVRFNALTYDGIRTASATQLELEDGSHPLVPLFTAGHLVVTELRLIEERTSP